MSVDWTLLDTWDAFHHRFGAPGAAVTMGSMFAGFVWLALVGIPIWLAACLSFLFLIAAAVLLVALAGRTAAHPQRAGEPLGPASVEEIERRLSLLEDRVRNLEVGQRSLEADHGVVR